MAEAQLRPEDVEWDDAITQQPTMGPPTDAIEWEDENQTTKRDLGEEIARDFALTGRSAVAGVASVPAIGADALATILNLGIDAFNTISGENIPKFRPLNDVVEQNMTEAGLPEPETTQERLQYATGKGATAFATSYGLASVVNPVSGTGQALKQALTVDPAAGVAAGGGAGLGSQYAVERQWGPVIQFLASLTGGALGGSIVNAARKVPAAIAPMFSTPARETIAGRVLNRYSGDAPVNIPGAPKGTPSPTPTIRNMEKRVGPTAAGTYPTAAQAAQKPGMSQLQRGLEGKGTPQAASISARKNMNASIRADRMQAATEKLGSLEQLKNIREQATDAARTQVFSSSNTNASRVAMGRGKQMVVRFINNLLKGKARITPEVKAALEEAKTTIQKANTAEEMYEARKHLGEMMSGTLAGDKASYRYASSQLISVRDKLDDAIDAAAPGFKNDYLPLYRQLSKPIDRRLILDDFTKKVVNANREMRPQIFANWWRDRDSVAQRVTGFKKARADDYLSPADRKEIKNVLLDLLQETRANNMGRVAGGSQTAQLENLTVGNIISRAGRGEKAWPAIRKVTDWLYSHSDDEVIEILTEVMSDPQKAARLMRKAAKADMGLIERDFMSAASSLGIATTLGGRSAVEPTEPKNRRPEPVNLQELLGVSP